MPCKMALFFSRIVENFFFLGLRHSNIITRTWSLIPYVCMNEVASSTPVLYTIIVLLVLPPPLFSSNSETYYA